MKAKIKETGVELEVHLVDKQARYIGSDGVTYWEEDLDFDIEDKDNLDYWTRLEHTYAGMAMNALLLTNNIRNGDLEGMRECNTNAMAIAYALVEKMKEERK